MDVRSTLLSLKQALESGDRQSVNDASRDLIAARAALGPQWQSIAMVLARNGEWTLALAAADLFAADTGQGWASGYAKANLLYESGRLPEALTELESLSKRGLAPARTEDQVSVLNFRASLAILLGRNDEARAHLDDALGLDPRSGQAWFSFAEIADFRGRDAAGRQALEAAFDEGASRPGEGAKLAHAAGRMRHQLGDFAGAFGAFDRGAEQFRTATRNQTKPQPNLAATSTGFPLDLIDRVASSITVPHERVLFVSGLPRSGTTLVEQILVSHPEVTHGEELGFFRILAQDIGGIDAASFERWLDRGNDPNRLVELYLHLAEERFGGGGKFVDKTIEAGNYMGLLLALFPKSPVFWMHRDPIDNGWSAFRTMFARGATWSWDLANIGQRLAQERRMIDHWSKAAGDRITFIDYETLVRDPEPQIRSIAAAAGLALDERMFSPHSTERAVATASVTQVREPINLKGLGVAAPYRQWLGPMVESYEAHSAASRTSATGVSTS